MPRFKGGASGLSPLAIQLQADPYGTDIPASTVEVVGFYAACQTDVGVATVVSRPVLTYPSSIGTPGGGGGGSNIVSVSNPGAVSHSELLVAYGTPPSFPVVSLYTTLGPFDVQWYAGTGEGRLILPGSAILLYGLGGAWNGHLEWDE